MFAFSYRFLVLYSYLLLAIFANAQEQTFVSSGDEELDSIRLEVAKQLTTRENFKLRALKMKLWVVTLQQQGARLEAYLPVDEALRKDIWWNTIDRYEGKSQEFTDEQMLRLTNAVDQGFAILDSIQNTFEINSIALLKSSAQTELNSSVQPEIPWTHYKGNMGLTGYTGAHGPASGKKAWTFPVGLSWESQPVIEDGRIYLSSPGMRTLMWCLDLNTGKEIWHTNQVVEIMGDQLYNTPNNQSTPVVLDKYVLYRELGARGNNGPTKEIVFVDKATGKIAKDMVVDGSASKEVYGFDINSGKILFIIEADDWVRAHPVMQGNQLFFATMKGTLYGYQINGNKAKEMFRLALSDHPILADLSLKDDKLIINDSDLFTHCVSTHGKPIWEISIIKSFMKNGERILSDQIAGGAYYQSKPTVANDAVFFRTPARFLYAVNAETGEKIWTHPGGGLSSLVVDDENVFFPSISDPYFYCVDANGNGDGTTTCKWMYKMGNKVEESTPAIYKGRSYVMSSDGYVHAIK